MTAKEAIQQIRDARQLLQDEWSTMTPEEIQRQLREAGERMQALTGKGVQDLPVELPAVPRAAHVEVTAESLRVELADGRTVIVPRSWFPRLQQATPKQLSHWRLIAQGRSIRWEELDEDLSVQSLLSAPPRTSAG